MVAWQALRATAVSGPSHNPVHALAGVARTWRKQMRPRLVTTGAGVYRTRVRAASELTVSSPSPARKRWCWRLQGCTSCPVPPLGGHRASPHLGEMVPYETASLALHFASSVSQRARLGPCVIRTPCSRLTAARFRHLWSLPPHPRVRVRVRERHRGCEGACHMRMIQSPRCHP